MHDSELHTAIVVVVASRALVARIVGVAALRAYLAVASVSVLLVGSSHGQRRRVVIWKD